MVKFVSKDQKYFEVPLKLVTKVPDSKLAEISTGKNINPKDFNGAFIIDENSEDFKIVLSYLQNDRSDKLDPWNKENDEKRAKCLIRMGVYPQSEIKFPNLLTEMLQSIPKIEDFPELDENSNYLKKFKEAKRLTADIILEKSGKNKLDYCFN